MYCYGFLPIDLETPASCRRTSPLSCAASRAAIGPASSISAPTSARRKPCSRVTPSPATTLRARLLLLLAVKRKQSHPGHLDDLESNARNVADSVAFAAKPSDQNLIVLVDEVEATVARHERGNF